MFHCERQAERKLNKNNDPQFARDIIKTQNVEGETKKKTLRGEHLEKLKSGRAEHIVTQLRLIVGPVETPPNILEGVNSSTNCVQLVYL